MGDTPDPVPEHIPIATSIATRIPGRDRWVYQESGAESWIQLNTDGSLTLGPLPAGDWHMFGTEGRAPKRDNTKKGEAP